MGSQRRNRYGSRRRQSGRWRGRRVALVALLLAASLVPALYRPDSAKAATLVPGGLSFESSRLNTDSTFIPPDTMGAVGPDHIVEMINGNFEIFNKDTGASLETRSLDSFWANRVGLAQQANGRRFDPRVVYDTASQRWFALSIDAGIDTTVPPDGVLETANNMFVGRSDTSDPTGDWDGVMINADSVGAREFHDYPTLGLDADGVYSCTQDFNGGGNESCYSFPKADLLAATPTAANLTRFEATPAGLPAVTGSWQPAVDFGASDGRAALLGSTGTALRRTSIVGAGAAGATLTASVPITGDPGHAAPPAARQPNDDNGEANTIENVAPRFVGNVFELGNSLWAVHSVLGTASNAALRWYNINETTNTVIQTGLIEDTTGPRDFHEPSIAVNSDGYVTIGYTCSGPNQAAGVCVSLGQTSMGTTTFDPPRLIQAGAGDYYRDFCTPPGCSERNRWGDYSAVNIDPERPCTFWTFQEYVAVGATGDVGPGELESGNWGVRVNELRVAECEGTADVAVAKDCPTSVNAGTAGNCTITLTNNGPKPALDVVLNDVHTGTKPFTFGTPTSTQGTCTTTPNPQPTTGTVTCDIGDIPFPGSVTVTVPVSSSEGQTINDTATATSAHDLTPANNSASDSMIVVAQADLSVAKDCQPDPVFPGGVLNCTLTVNNAGPSTAANVTVTDDLPENVQLQGTPTGGGFSCTTQAPDPEITCTKASQPVGTVQITYSVFVSEDTPVGSSFSNTAKVTSVTADPALGNNSETEFTSTPACTITGSEAGDRIVGTAGNDVICGLGGSDRIDGMGGDDLIVGGAGGDVLIGGPGNDTLIGGNDGDRLNGDAGDDRMFGGNEGDTMYGGDGNDVMFGRAGGDSVIGNNGTDSADGGPDQDSCQAEVQVGCP